MGNKPQIAIAEADSLSKSQVKIGVGATIAPIAENSEAVVYSTKFHSPYITPSHPSRQIGSVMAQDHGHYIVRPKNTLADGKILQAKSLNPQPSKLYYIVRKQDGADKWINNE